MSGDYTRFTFDPLKRYSGVLMQQGRVQLDSDWNEEIDILKRRLRTTALDIFGPVGVPYLASPDAFKVGFISGPPANLSIEPGRLYVDGVQIEAFAEDGATYNNQPFFPPQSAGFPPPALPAAGDAIVYLDVWDREVTYIEDTALLDVALGGADTATRRQTVWQVRVGPMPGAACGVPVGEPPSAGRLTTQAVASPAPDDPCILPQASGYRGLENRLYRVEVHQGGPLGAARFKWSRDNGTIVSAVRAIAVSGAQTTLTVNRIGRDQFMRFMIGDWVSVTDDHRELMGEAGEMALIVDLDEANRQIVIDRALPTGGGRPFGANATQIAERHTRIQKWDQTAATNAIDGDGLIMIGAGPIAIEDGVEVLFSATPAGGSFRAGDYWVFWARTATAEIEILTAAPPRGIEHHYVQLAAITGLGGAAPDVTDCRPPPPQQGAGDCCCTIIVRPGQSIQAGIDALPDAGGCVCLKTGLHIVREPIRIARGGVALNAESPGTTVRSEGAGPVLIIGNPAGRGRVEGVDVLGIDFEGNETSQTGGGTAPAPQVGEGVISVVGSERVRIAHCGMSARRLGFFGLLAVGSDRVNVFGCRFRQLTLGILVRDRCAQFEADSNTIELEGQERAAAIAGIAVIESAFPCRITRNLVSGALFGILLNDDPFGRPRSLAHFSIVADNLIDGATLPEGDNTAIRIPAIDCAADYCAITGNKISYSNRIYTGIRATGSFFDISGNVLLAPRRELDIAGPIAIQVGDVAVVGRFPVLGGIVAHNTITGAQHGVVCTDAINLVVETNVIEGGFGRMGFAIMGTRIGASTFAGNRIGGALSGVFLQRGRQNRVADNDCRDGEAGISVLQEAGPEIAGNRLDQLGLWAVFGMLISARFGVTGNRIVNCGHRMGNIAFAVGCSAVAGEAHISGNEIMDTGSDGGPNAASIADYGVYGDLILEARVSDNLVTYSNAAARNTAREDRALIMRGLMEFSLGDNELTFGFPIQIHGNKFIGTGQTALVELRESTIVIPPFGNQLRVRFERVSFDHNYCSHLSPPNDADSTRATVWLVGRRAIVMGNHIKTVVRAFASVNFNNMPGPFIGNVTSGGAVNHPDFPVTQANFNLIA